MMMQFDRISGTFVLPESASSDGTDKIVAGLNRALIDVRQQLNLKRRNGRYANGFLIEMVLRSVCRYNIDAICDEIGKLEGIDPRPSWTKKAKRMRAPLGGLWHKHYCHSGFLVKNLSNEYDRMVKDGRWKKMFAPHCGKCPHEFMDQIAHEMVIEGYERRAQDHRMTGEFIVYEPQSDRSNHYLTLGSHGEYVAIRARVSTYKQFDLG